MLNNNMEEKIELKSATEASTKQPMPKPANTPDENSGVYMQSYVNIFDPDTKEIYFAGRA